MLCATCGGEIMDRAAYCPHCGQGVEHSPSYEGDFEYEAFISYRHLERDRAVALTVQKKLEGMRIPKNIQGLAGRKKLGKCFRDEDELPTCGTLSDAINHALEHSRYLIVVASPQLRESLWCQSEVETFASLHGRDRVLVAFAAGEPDQSFPQLVLNRLDPATGALVPAEPLAADLRNASRAKTDAEVQRLAASLIGCNYDDLRQRLRARKMRIISLVCVIAAVVGVLFGGFSLFQQSQIEANYQQALGNQSEYLAQESEELFANGYRMQAIQTSLAALPESSADASRPYVPHAMLALESALEVYPTSEYWRSRYALDLENVKETVVDEDAGKIAFFVKKSSQVLSCSIRDAASGAQEASFDVDLSAYLDSGSSVNLEDLHFQANRIVMRETGSDQVLLIDASGGETTALLPDGEQPDFVGVCNGGATAVTLSHTGYVGSEGFSETLRTVDLATKEVTLEYPLTGASGSIEDCAVSDDGGFLAFASSETASSYESPVFLYHVKVVNTTTRTCLSLGDISADSCLLTIQDNLVYASASTQEGSLFHSVLTAFDRDTEQPAWSVETREAAELEKSNSSQGYEYEIPCYEIGGAFQDGGRSVLLVHVGSKLICLDRATGEKMSEAAASHFIVKAQLDKSAARLCLALSNGCILRYRVSVENCASVGTCLAYGGFLTGEDVRSASFVQSGDDMLAIVAPKSDEILGAASSLKVLSTDVDSQVVKSDVNAEFFEDVHAQSSLRYNSDASLFTVAPSASIDASSDGTALTVYDGTTFEPISHVPASLFGQNASSSSSRVSVTDLSFCRETGVLLACASNALYAINPNTGELIASVGDLKYAGYADGGGVVAVITKDEDGLSGVAHLLCLDATTFDVKRSADVALSSDETVKYLVATGDSAVVVTESRSSGTRAVLVSYESGEQSGADIGANVPLEGDYSAEYQIYACTDGGGYVAVCADSKLRKYDAAGKILWERDETSLKPFVDVASTGSILVQGDDRTLALLDGKSGQVLATTNSVSLGISKGSFSSDGTRYAASLDGFTTCLGIINLDPDSFGLETQIEGGKTPLSGWKDVLVVENDKMYTVPLWTLEQLRACALERIAGHELTSAQRSKYLIG